MTYNNSIIVTDDPHYDHDAVKRMTDKIKIETRKRDHHGVRDPRHEGWKVYTSRMKASFPVRNCIVWRQSVLSFFSPSLFGLFWRWKDLNQKGAQRAAVTLVAWKMVLRVKHKTHLLQLVVVSSSSRPNCYTQHKIRVREAGRRRMKILLMFQRVLFCSESKNGIL